MSSRRLQTHARNECIRGCVRAKQAGVVPIVMYWQSVSISDEFHFIAHQFTMNSVSYFSYIRGVRLSPSTAAPNRHVVPAPDDR